MVPPFDIFRVKSDGNLLWKDTAQTRELARLRIKILMVAEPGDYVIYSQQTGHKVVVRADLSDTEPPACPTHGTYMVPHTFEAWESSPVQGIVKGFRCPNLDCSVVYIEGALEGFYMLEPNGHLVPYPKSGQE